MDNEKPPLSIYEQTLPGSYEKNLPPSYGHIPPPSYDHTASANYEPNAPPNYGQPLTQVVVTQASPLILGPQPTNITCPRCHGQVTTAMEIQSSTKTHLIALLLFLVFFPLACVPYFVDSCKSKNHYCPNCAAYLGRYDH